ncbi:MAG TPA: hypothetical protein PK511_15410 [Chitinophagales bacterium]|nr:hypothetical protein [Chitinophagales bacterium]HNE47467.1 hypothetical protein [Chitinophagales bacterium]HNI55914.1 hypothetical protein [Chitinophagales bacterium]HNJ90787.1 hypothetical protein [Chitinophagales bacterium]
MRSGRNSIIGITILMLTLVSTALLSCEKEYQCDCYQDVMGIDTTYSLVGHGRDAQDVCNAFDSETTEFGITKTVDCEPY